MIPLQELTGAIIAGGRARRLNGLAKGLVNVGGESIMARQLRLLESRCIHRFIVGDPAGPYGELGVPIHADLIASKGPPGGVHCALSYASTPWVIVLGCDLPSVTASLIDGLRVPGNHDVCWYRAAGRPQPLVSCWRRTVVDRLAAKLTAASPGFRDLTADLRVRELQAVEELFFNVNTPSDLKRLRGG